jgi:hypothetical protein
MCAFVALIEGENELGAIVTAICMKCFRKHWRLADQNARRYENCDEISSPHEYPEALRGMVALETIKLEEWI